jgi:hypothetical protein
MNTINQYKNRFYNLLESTMGDVRPLITEDETVSGSPEFNQIVKNLGFEIEINDEDPLKFITNAKQVLNPNVTERVFLRENYDNKQIELITPLKKVGKQWGDGFFRFTNLNKSVSLDTIKKSISDGINGIFDKNLFSSENKDFLKFYDLFLNNNLDGYDGYIAICDFYFGTNGQISKIDPFIVFVSKNLENKVKFFGLNTTYIGYVDVSYNNTSRFKKEYVLDGNKISFEKDRKSTKPTGRYKSESGLSLYDIADTDKYVRQGMKGDIVKQIQHKLLKSGQLKTPFKLAADNQKCINDYTFCHGTFGPKTYAAVKEFQDANDLVVDGIVGPDTAEALRYV